MKRRAKKMVEESCFDLIDRACHLLRRTPLSVWFFYYLGAIPFVLGLLFFLADMSASPFAPERCVVSAFGLGLLYLWLRIWQAQFCRRLADRVAQRKIRSVSVRWMVKQIELHLVYSSWGLVLLPLSLLATIPFCWVFAYFNNLCIVDLASGTVKEAVANARRLAMPWPTQNHLVVSLLFVFGGLVFLNWISVLALLPSLFKSLVGIESIFSQSYYWMANTTFIGVVMALTYLTVDPLVKAIYVLRFYSAESITTGVDLLTELKQLPPPRRIAGFVRAGLCIAVLFCAPFSRGQTSAPVHVPAFQDTELNASIERVMKRSEFTWRMPRDLAPEDETPSGFFGQFIKSASQGLEKALRVCRDGIRRIYDWLIRRFYPAPPDDSSRGFFNPVLFQNLAILFLILLVGIFTGYLVRLFRARRGPLSSRTEARPLCAPVDMEDENLVATQLAEDEWIALARSLVADGELRKAMRAWFFAGLAMLARTDLLVILHSKSNLDYSRELNRRARRCPAVVPLFEESILLFERTWYGLHPVTEEAIRQLENNMERMRHGIQT